MTSESSGSGWKPSQVYIMAMVCLALGLALGYLFRGSETRHNPAPATAEAVPAAGMQQMPTLDQMKHMADKQAEPLLEKLKGDPTNASLLSQVARIYEATHQFKTAADYYAKSVDADPKNVSTRNRLASVLYYNGDIDGALSQLDQCLKVTPNDANALFNQGLIRWKGKNDAPGAVAVWQQLLKSNPKLEQEKRAEVEKLIATAQQPGTANPQQP